MNQTCTASLLGHPEVKKLVTGIARRYVRNQDVEDIYGEALAKVLEWRASQPALFAADDLEACKAVAGNATRWVVVDRARKEKRRRKTDAGLTVDDADACATPDLHPGALDPIDVKRALERFEQDVAASPNPEVIGEIFERLLSGEDQAQIAREMGMGHQEVRDRVRKVRAGSKQAWAAALGIVGGGALYGIAAFLLASLTFSSHVEPHRSVAAGVRYEGSQVATEIDPAVQAGEIRARASAECRERRFDECLADLDLAAALDPMGDQTPEVQTARDYASMKTEDQLRSMTAKPGGR